MKAMVVVTVDSLARMFKDYLGEENLPADAQPVALMVKPSEQGRFALVMESESWDGDKPPISVEFRLKRIFSTPGGLSHVG